MIPRLGIDPARVRQSPEAARQSARATPKGGVAADKPGKKAASVRQLLGARKRRGAAAMRPARTFVGRGGSASAESAQRRLPKGGGCR